MQLENLGLTINVRDGIVTIITEDKDASVRFLEVQIHAIDFMSVLATHGSVSCVGFIRGLNKLGKKMQNERFEFEVPEHIYSSRRESSEIHGFCSMEMQKQGKDDWTCDGTYDQQDSFFRKDDKYFARTTIRRWV